MSGWPGDADAVIRRIRAELAAAGDQLGGLDAVRISADLRGDDLEQLTFDASGVALQLRPQPSATPPPGIASAHSDTTAATEIRSRRPGIARRVRLIAAPARVDGIPLTVDVELLDLPIDWLEYEEPSDPTRPETVVGIDVRDDEGVRGALSASIRSNDIGPLFERIARAALEADGVDIRSVRIDLRQDGADGIRIAARVGVRWKLLSASARMRARLRISPDAVVTVRDLGVSSRNPIVALALFAARTQVRAQIGRTLDLNDETSSSGVRLHDVRLTAGRDLKLSARVGKSVSSRRR